MNVSYILEHTVLGIKASILVQNAPKSLAAGAPPHDPAGGAYSAPPDPLAVMGWDGDLDNFLGCKLCAPLLVAGAPLLF